MELDLRSRRCVPQEMELDGEDCGRRGGSAKVAVEEDYGGFERMRGNNAAGWIHNSVKEPGIGKPLPGGFSDQHSRWDEEPVIKIRFIGERSVTIHKRFVIEWRDNSGRSDSKNGMGACWNRCIGGAMGFEEKRVASWKGLFEAAPCNQGGPGKETDGEAKPVRCGTWQGTETIVHGLKRMKG